MGLEGGREGFGLGVRDNCVRLFGNGWSRSDALGGEEGRRMIDVVLGVVLVGSEIFTTTSRPFDLHVLLLSWHHGCMLPHVE